MKVTFNPSALRRTKWYEYAVRFIFGGSITAAAGIIAKLWGPTIGGLFLAFPAIFPASATLLEKHQKQKKPALGPQRYHSGERGSQCRSCRHRNRDFGPADICRNCLAGDDSFQTLGGPERCIVNLVGEFGSALVPAKASLDWTGLHIVRPHANRMESGPLHIGYRS